MRRSIPKGSRKSFSASLYSDENGKIKITNGEQADKIEADLQNAEYVITKVKNGTRKKISCTSVYNINSSAGSIEKTRFPVEKNNEGCSGTLRRR